MIFYTKVKYHYQHRQCIMSLISFYFFHEIFQVLRRFTDSRNCLTGYSKAGGSDNHEKEVACHIKNELEMSVVLIDNRKRESSKKNIT